MKELKLSEVSKLLQGNLNFDYIIEDITTDSRKAKKGSLFVAIKGDNMDGNAFVKNAFENGAECAVVSEIAPDVDPTKVILVKDTKQAYIQIGGLYRSKFNIPFVGVTGSVGKTTTKEFISCVLNKKYKTLITFGNQNNEIGVPNTLFRLTDEHTAVVIEMGMCNLGEIHDLAVQVKPQVGVITSIGVSHIEQLGSRENILKAKMEIIDGMPQGSTLIVCGDNDFLSDTNLDGINVIKYGITNSKCDVRANSIIQTESGMEFIIESPWGSYVGKIPAIGSHNVLDSIAAFAVGCVMGVAPEQAAKALMDYLPAGMRQNVVRFNNMVVVEDCYNSSPDSLKAAVLALASTPCKGRRIMIAADMLELGEQGVLLHSQCGEFIAKHEIDMLLTYGDLAEHIVIAADKCGMKRCFHYQTKEALADELTKAVRAEDVIWFKASRGMKLEEVIETFYKKGENK